MISTVRRFIYDMKFVEKPLRALRDGLGAYRPLLIDETLFIDIGQDLPSM